MMGVGVGICIDCVQCSHGSFVHRVSVNRSLESVHEARVIRVKKDETEIPTALHWMCASLAQDRNSTMTGTLLTMCDVSISLCTSGIHPAICQSVVFSACSSFCLSLSLSATVSCIQKCLPVMKYEAHSSTYISANVNVLHQYKKNARHKALADPTLRRWCQSGQVLHPIDYSLGEVAHRTTATTGSTVIETF